MRATSSYVLSVLALILGGKVSSDTDLKHAEMTNNVGLWVEVFRSLQNHVSSIDLKLLYCMQGRFGRRFVNHLEIPNPITAWRHNSTERANMFDSPFSYCLADRVLQNQVFFESSLDLGKFSKVVNFIRALLCLVYCLDKAEIAHVGIQIDLTVLIKQLLCNKSNRT